MYKLKLITNDASFMYESETEELPKSDFIKARACETWFLFYVKRDEIKFYRVYDKKDDKQKENN